MWALWLNRVGIILNFVAGFLVAPELLGIRRLEWADARLKRFSEKGKARLQAGAYVSKGALARAMRNHQAGFLATIFLVSALFWSSWWWVWYTKDWTWSLIPALLYVAVGVLMYFVSAMAPGIRTSQMLVLAVRTPLSIFTAETLWIVRELIGVIATVARDKLLEPTIAMLEAGDNRARFLLVPVGIICFILGNLLQFIATFL